jgi:peptidoglycan/xylan/chitin deacetylase (PgdA/CDA1 family)
MSGTRRPGLYILLYHRVSPTVDPFAEAMPLAAFEQQVAFLARNFRVERLESLVAEGLGRFREPTVAITFDDGHRDVLDHAYPVLARHRLPASVYVVTDCADGQTLLWPEVVEHLFRESPAERLAPGARRPLDLDLPLTTMAERVAACRLVKERLKAIPDAVRRGAIENLGARLRVTDLSPLRRSAMGWEELRFLAGQGWGVGSHSRRHPILSRLPEDEAVAEVVESKARLEAEVGRPVVTFAYPNGKAEDFSRGIKAAIAKAGYRAAVTTLFGVNQAPTDAFELRRIYFARRVLGSLPVRAAAWLRQLLAGGWA